MARGSRMVLAFALLLLGGCPQGDGEPPPPRALSRDAVGYYCNMIVAEHSGPKGQIFVVGRDDPLWFSSVRDTLAFTLLPEEPKNLAAVYVTDMGRSPWEAPAPGIWIDARTAWFVIGSGRTGGMGAPEAVPFLDQAAARRFAGEHGGEVFGFDRIPTDAILAPVDESAGGSTDGSLHRGSHEEVTQ